MTPASYRPMGGRGAGFVGAAEPIGGDVGNISASLSLWKRVIPGVVFQRPRCAGIEIARHANALVMPTIEEEAAGRLSVAVVGLY